MILFVLSQKCKHDCHSGLLSQPQQFCLRRLNWLADKLSVSLLAGLILLITDGLLSIFPGMLGCSH